MREDLSIGRRLAGLASLDGPDPEEIAAAEAAWRALAQLAALADRLVRCGESRVDARAHRAHRCAARYARATSPSARARVVDRLAHLEDERVRCERARRQLRTLSRWLRVAADASSRAADCRSLPQPLRVDLVAADPDIRLLAASALIRHAADGLDWDAPGLAGQLSRGWEQQADRLEFNPHATARPRALRPPPAVPGPAPVVAPAAARDDEPRPPAPPPGSPAPVTGGAAASQRMRALRLRLRLAGRRARSA